MANEASIVIYVLMTLPTTTAANKQPKPTNPMSSEKGFKIWKFYRSHPNIPAGNHFSVDSIISDSDRKGFGYTCTTWHDD